MNLKELLQTLSPDYRRTQEKRRLQAVIREHGIPRKLAEKIANHYFQRPQQ